MIDTTQKKILYIIERIIELCIFEETRELQVFSKPDEAWGFRLIKPAFLLQNMFQVSELKIFYK